MRLSDFHLFSVGQLSVMHNVSNDKSCKMSFGFLRPLLGAFHHSMLHLLVVACVNGVWFFSTSTVSS